MSDVLKAMAAEILARRPFDDAGARLIAMRALRAAEAAGWVLVPRDPTEAMLDALAKESGWDGGEPLMSDGIRAAIEAGRVRLEETDA